MIPLVAHIVAVKLALVLLMILLYYEICSFGYVNSHTLVNMQIKTIFYTIGPTSPMQPTIVRVVSTDATTATVQWTVPLIAYTPETYIVSYSTGNVNFQVRMSDPVESGADFDAVNQMFSVELTGLEPNTAYNYQVISSNIVGTNTSESQSLNTTAGNPINYVDKLSHEFFNSYIIVSNFFQMYAKLLNPPFAFYIVWELYSLV